MVTTSPISETRGLIDASEKPLRRSPPGKPQHEEEWPVLFPEKPTTPGTLRKMTQQDYRDSHTASVQPASDDKESYPALAKTQFMAPGTDHEQIGEGTFAQSIQRKPLATDDCSNTANPRAGKDIAGQGAPGAAKLGVQDVGDKKKTGSDGINLVHGSAGVPTALKKPEEETNDFVQTRQPTTSSLRPRLSAGHHVKDGSSPSTKIVASADPKHPKSSKEHDGKSTKSTLRPSNERRVPAKFIAGSRPSFTHGPSSRSTLRSDIHTSSLSNGSCLPGRLAPAVLSHKQDDPSITSAFQEVQNSEEVDSRRSSIPVFRGTVSTLIDKTNDAIDAPLPRAKKVSKDEFDIFEDSVHSFNAPSKDGYKVKRLSMTSPDHGPTLKISPSANRLIMGEEANKENTPQLQTDGHSNLRRAVVTNELQKNSKGAHRTLTNLKQSRRPLSSQGLPDSTSRVGLLDSEVREKKAKSAEVSHKIPMKHSEQTSRRLKPPVASRNQTSSSNDDPFFDVRSHLEAVNGEMVATKSENQDLGNKAISEHDWISPMPQRTSLTSLSDSMPPNPELPPSTDQEHISKLSRSGLSKSRAGGLISDSNKTSRYDLENYGNETAPFMPSQPPLSTPEHLVQAAPDSHSDSYPPRSSSRAAVLDFTQDGSGIASTVSPSEAGKHLSKDFTTHQKKVVSSQELGSSPLNLAGQEFKRGSVAQESNKSHGSVSKKVFSNFRGLFHKRSSGHSEVVSSIKPNKKGNHKSNVAKNVSPFPPTSEVHPIHRPTLSSLSRSVTTLAKVQPVEMRCPAPVTPSFNSPVASELSTTTAMAMQILESARKEKASPKKERLLELGRVMVDAITQVRDAEKAMEEAKQAARKAEVASLLCKKSVRTITKNVQEWRSEMRA